MRREWEEYLRDQDPKKARRWIDAMNAWLPVVDALEQSLAEGARTIRGLSDGEAADALADVLKGYSAESSGILYRPTSPSPRVEAVSRGVREAIEGLRAS